MKIPRYIVFANENYYPAGGWFDIYGYTGTLALAEDLLKEALKINEWGHIVDLGNALTPVIKREGRGYGQPE